MKISRELCEFVGAVIGDGNLWTDGSRYRIEITGDSALDRSYYVYLSQIAFGLFGKEPYAPRVRQRGLRLRLQSKYAFGTLTSLGLPVGRGKSRNVAIPDRILRKGWDYAKWTIRGVVDTDGTLFFSKKTYKKAIYPTIEIRTYSRMLAWQITEVLCQNGFRAKQRGNEREGFHVALYGPKMVNKWIKDIGFSNAKHTNKLQQHKNLISKG